ATGGHADWQDDEFAGTGGFDYGPTGGHAPWQDDEFAGTGGNADWQDDEFAGTGGHADWQEDETGEFEGTREEEPAALSATIQASRMSAPTLALCMIVGDEAAHLDRALSSVAGAYDQLVVVHTGSQAETVAVAGRWGARIVPYARANGPDGVLRDFAAARN